MRINEVLNLFKLHAVPDSLGNQEIRDHSDILKPNEFYTLRVEGKVKDLLKVDDYHLFRIQDTKAFPITVTARYRSNPELHHVLLSYFGQTDKKQVFDITQPGNEQVKFKLIYTEVNRQWPVILTLILIHERKTWTCIERYFYSSVSNYHNLIDEFDDLR